MTSIGIIVGCLHLYNTVQFQTFCDIKDLSYGKETVPISCVNGIDRQYPDYVEYSNIRMPMKGVELNLDEDFLVGCDCTDGCRVRYQGGVLEGGGVLGVTVYRYRNLEAQYKYQILDNY